MSSIHFASKRNHFVLFEIDILMSLLFRLIVMWFCALQPMLVYPHIDSIHTCWCPIVLVVKIQVPMWLCDIHSDKNIKKMKFFSIFFLSNSYFKLVFYTFDRRKGISHRLCVLTKIVNSSILLSVDL